MRAPLTRSEVFPESEIPDAGVLLAEGRAMARWVQVAPSPFLVEKNVRSEAEYKQRRAAEGRVMLHAQIGYRDFEKTRRAYREIYESLERAGHGVDRYGICLDWSMGYPAEQRRERSRGTGLILERPEDFARLTREAPAAPHFGDFVIGLPAAVENTAAALAAGSTAIGNLGQYFTFRLPYWTDEVETTAATVKALALAAAQPVPVLIHSNLDDGFAAQFQDMTCALGMALIEQHIVEDGIGGRIAHCYGHTYSEPLTRLAFQRALAAVQTGPGTMVYGNTTIYGPEGVENYARLAGYLIVDILAQRTRPTGHAVNPVPVTEAMRIPEIGEVIDAHRYGLRLIESAEKLEGLFNPDAADEVAGRIERGAKRFKDAVLTGLEEAGIDTASPFELLLALKRIGAKRLETWWGPGRWRASAGREPVVKSSTISELEARARRFVADWDKDKLRRVCEAGLSACIATTDVHEYGKILVGSILTSVGVRLADAGVSVDPEALAITAKASRADFIALSSYNGVALDYVERLRRAMAERELDIPLFIGGKLNQIRAGDAGSLPVDVGRELEEAGAVPCRRVEDMMDRLAEMVPGP